MTHCSEHYIKSIAEKLVKVLAEENCSTLTAMRVLDMLREGVLAHSRVHNEAQYPYYPYSQWSADKGWKGVQGDEK